MIGAFRKFWNHHFFRLVFLALICYLPGCAHNPVMGPFPSGPMAPNSVIAEPPFLFPRDFYHEVGPSETLWRISKTYDVDMSNILRVNHLSDPNQIVNGEKILIPQTRGPRAVIPLYPTKRWTHIVIHHTATEMGNARTIDIMHHERGFWNGLGYDFLIDNGTDSKMDGQIEVGPRWIKQEVGAHANAAGMNEKGIGIALIGNFSKERVSPRELDSLVFLVKTLKNYYHIPDENIIGHRDVPGKTTECPGTLFPWQEFKQRIKG